MILKLVLHPQKNRQSISLNFPEGKQKNILMKGSKDMRFESKNLHLILLKKEVNKQKENML